MVLVNIFKPLSTFLSPASLINLSNIDNNFASEIFLKLEIEPGTAGGEASMLHLCYQAPPSPTLLAYLMDRLHNMILQQVHDNRNIKRKHDTSGFEPLTFLRMSSCPDITFLTRILYFSQVDHFAATGSLNSVGTLELSLKRLILPRTFTSNWVGEQTLHLQVCLSRAYGGPSRAITSHS